MNVPEVRARKIVHQSVSVAALKIMRLGVHATRAKVLSAAQRHVEEEEKKDFQRASSSSDALAASSSAAATAAPTDSPAGGATSGSGSALATPAASAPAASATSASFRVSSKLDTSQLMRLSDMTEAIEELTRRRRALVQAGFDHEAEEMSRQLTRLREATEA